MTRNDAAARLREWDRLLDAALAEERRAAMLRLLDELEVGFANNPKHHEAVINRVREAIEKGQPLPTETFAAAVRRGAA